MESILEARNVSRGFPLPGGQTFMALKSVNLLAPTGKLTILKGRSGSGKTTLLNILSALDLPTEGAVLLDGQDVTKLSEAARTRLRRTQVGYVFQSVALIPMMTALENVEFSLRLVKYRGDRRARALECLSQVGLRQRAGHMPQEMSGGEQQRVAVARAIAHRPRVLFADEPTGALDTNTGLQVVKTFKELCSGEGITIVMTTHDTGLMDIGDAVYELEDGEMVHADRG